MGYLWRMYRTPETLAWAIAAFLAVTLLVIGPFVSFGTARQPAAAPAPVVVHVQVTSHPSPKTVHPSPKTPLPGPASVSGGGVQPAVLVLPASDVSPKRHADHHRSTKPQPTASPSPTARPTPTPSPSSNCLSALGLVTICH